MLRRVDLAKSSGASITTAILFTVLVVMMSGVVGVSLRRAGVSGMILVVALLAYLVIPAALARARVLDRYAPMPAPPMLMMFAVTVVTVAFVLSRVGTRVASEVGVAWVVLLQGFRVAVEWLLHRLYLEGVVPVQMTYAGRNLDIISGVTGVLLGVWLLRTRTVRRSVVLAWNVLGLGLLANIVGVAMLSTPGPLRHFDAGPPNLLLSTFPYVWLPTFLVQVALGSHLLVFRQLSRARV